MPNPASIRTARRRRIFLRVLAETSIVAEACRAAGAANGSFYNWRHADANFAADWDRALAAGISTLEDEAIRRARDGVEKPVFYQGKQVATTRAYSDRLLIFLLKAHKPDRYREQLWWSRRDGGPAAPDTAPEEELSPAELDARITQLLRETGFIPDILVPADRPGADAPLPFHPPP